MAQVPPSYAAAFQRWGYLADAEAHKYGLPNGATLLAKIGYVETRYSKNLEITSGAGARGPMQFMPATRAAYIKQYHVDPWASVDEAVHAAAIFMKTTGLAGYNPGSPYYIPEVLKAPVRISAQTSPPGKRTGGVAASAAATPQVSSASAGSSLMRFLLTGALVLGGAGLAGFGIMRASGSSPFQVAARGPIGKKSS